VPKQSATTPRFRCNGCKEYHKVDTHSTYYQCPQHGYLCKEWMISSESEVRWVKRKDYYKHTFKKYTKVKFPEKYHGTCWWDKGSKKSDPWTHTRTISDSKNPIFNDACKNTPLIFHWHADVGRWIEEGMEDVQKAKAKPKASKQAKPDYLKEITVLLDLFEDDTLSKDVFIKKMRQKLK
tara:strand:+ start:2368 stop:2907 length:540 start_codon:yes stop_codon:yes gene_type:complete